MKATKLPSPAPEVFKTFLGDTADVTIYTSGGVTHWVHISHLDGTEETVRVMSRAKAVILAVNLHRSSMNRSTTEISDE